MFDLMLLQIVRSLEIVPLDYRNVLLKKKFFNLEKESKISKLKKKFEKLTHTRTVDNITIWIDF